MKLLDNAVWYAAVLLSSLICGFGTYRIFAPVAYAQRGYFAIGGEVLLALMVGYFVAIVLIRNKRYIIRKIRKIRRILK